MPRGKRKEQPEQKPAKRKKHEQPELPPGDQKETRYSGPWFKLEADALVSKTYTGRVDLGRYTEPEKRKGKLDDRIKSLEAQGYRNISVREIPIGAD